MDTFLPSAWFQNRRCFLTISWITAKVCRICNSSLQLFCPVFDVMFSHLKHHDVCVWPLLLCFYQTNMIYMSTEIIGRSTCSFIPVKSLCQIWETCMWKHLLREICIAWKHLYYQTCRHIPHSVVSCVDALSYSVTWNSQTLIAFNVVSILRSRQKSSHIFTEDNFKWIFLNEDVWISTNIFT